MALRGIPETLPRGRVVFEVKEGGTEGTFVFTLWSGTTQVAVMPGAVTDREQLVDFIRWLKQQVPSAEINDTVIGTVHDLSE